MTESQPVLVAAAKAPAEISIAGEALLWFGVIVIVFLVFIFAKAQLSRSNKIDLTDLLIDPAIKKITQGRFWSLIGGAAGTYVFIYLAVSGHFDATYASAYLLAVFGLKVAGDITGKPTPLAAGSSEVTERTERIGPAIDAAPAAAAESATQGTKTLAPKIAPSDVGKSVVIEPTTRSKATTKRRRK